MIFLFYFFSFVLVFLSYKSLTGGIAYLRFFREKLNEPRSDFAPPVTIFAPCRGVDPGMSQNLRSLLCQDLPEYEVIFIVDDVTDPAVAVIEEVIRKAESKNPNTSLIVAPKAVGCSQKVENLREAVLHADDRSEIFVFVDSDIRPMAGWLRGLIEPLEDADVGAATGYRWFISPTRNLGSELRSVWNASIATALGPNTASNFCWGGSMAIRRDVFERIGMREKWSSTLSDDFAVTRAMNEAKLPIVFVPQALTASVEDCSAREMLEFTTRQMKITRVYAPHLWIMSFVGSGLFNGVLIAAFLIVLISRANSFDVWFSIAVILLVVLFSVGKSWLRLRAVALVLTDHAADLRRQFWPQNTLWLLIPAVFFYNSVAAWLSRRMTWRGTRYELKSPNETVIITDVTARRN